MAYVLTSLSGNLISAASAAYAPTNSADVSAIASAYAADKQDASAMSAYALSSDVSGVIDTVSSNSASWAGGGATGDYLTAKVGSGQATFTTAFQDEMEKRPSLVISAERTAGAKMYPRMMITDWNGTTGDTHSGMLLANAFEFYICPQTARGKVNPSGLVQSRLDASQLQFNIDPEVSSFTRSSEFTRSGMRLGMSANTASWVAISGNSYSGGFITLDDGSGVSGHIVASSIPYWNDKLDGSASSSYYTTANESGFVDSAYVDSAVSGKQDSLTFAYDADSAISSINGSALAGGGGGSVTGDYVENSALDSASARSAVGSVLPFVTGISSISGKPLIPTLLANPTMQYGGQSTFAYMPASSLWTTADAATGIFSPLQYATGACLAMDAGYFKAYYKGNEWFVTDSRYGYARGEVHQSRGCRVIVEHTGGAGAVLSAKNIQANVTLNSTAYGTAKMEVANSQAYVQVQRGNHNSKYNSAKLDTDYLKFYNGMTTGYLDPEDTASGTAYLPAETEYMYISSIPYWNGKQDALTAGNMISLANDIVSVSSQAGITDIVSATALPENPVSTVLYLITEA